MPQYQDDAGQNEAETGVGRHVPRPVAVSQRAIKRREIDDQIDVQDDVGEDQTAEGNEHSTDDLLELCVPFYWQDGRNERNADQHETQCCVGGHADKIRIDLHHPRHLKDPSCYDSGAEKKEKDAQRALNWT